MKKLGRFEKMSKIFEIFRDFQKIDQHFAKGSLTKKSRKSENLGENLENLEKNRKKIDIFSKHHNLFMNHVEKKCRTWYTDAKLSYKSIARG